jgi:hypothetical protein
MDTSNRHLQHSPNPWALIPLAVFLFTYTEKSAKFLGYEIYVRKSNLTKRSKTGRIRRAFNKKGENKIRVFYNDGFKRKKANCQIWVDNLKVPFSISTTSLTDRLKAEKCELCGAENKKLHMHHVRKLKGLENKKPWERHMIARRRKTIALCASYHKLTDIGKRD